jgi:hypothetical protein
MRCQITIPSYSSSANHAGKFSCSWKAEANGVATSRPPEVAGPIVPTGEVEKASGRARELRMHKGEQVPPTLGKSTSS